MRTTEPIDGGSVETEDLVECKRRCGHCALGLWRRRVVEVGKGRGSIASLFFTNWMPVSAVHRSVLGVGWCVVLGLFVCCEVFGLLRQRMGARSRYAVVACSAACQAGLA